MVDPTRPPSRLAELVARPRSPLFALRVVGGVSLAVVVAVVTRWPVAAVGLGGLVAFWPALMGGSRDEQLQIVRLEAVVTWCEALRDTTTGHAGLEQAIPATAENAAPPIRPALLRLTGQLRSKVPLEQGLQDLAEQLNHSADLIIAALQMNVRTRGDGLVGVLTNLSMAGREELDLRRKITAGRAGDRRAVQLMLLIVLAVATFLVLFSDAYTAPYRTFSGQVALAVVLGLFRDLVLVDPQAGDGQARHPVPTGCWAAHRSNGGPHRGRVDRDRSARRADTGRDVAVAGAEGACLVIGMAVVGAAIGAVLLFLVLKVFPPKRTAIVQLGQYCDELAAAVQAHYPAVLIYRDRTAMFADLPLTRLPGFKSPRLGEAARRWLRVYLLVFLAVTAVVGALPMHTATAAPAWAALWVAVLAGSAALTLGGVIVRSSMITFVGITAVAWMVTAESLSTVGSAV